MALEVVGAGLGRTGTASLKLALEQLLERPCYHMSEAIERPQDTAVWRSALRGEPVDWNGFLAVYAATVDWPACAFWRPLLVANPEAVVLLSSRESAEAWWRSMERTIVATLSAPVPEDDRDWQERRAMTMTMIERFDPDWRRAESAIAAYEAHNEAVRAEVPAERLIDWQPGAGWEPICSALRLPVPDTPFPHTNTTADFRGSQEIDART